MMLEFNGEQRRQMKYGAGSHLGRYIRDGQRVIHLDRLFGQLPAVDVEAEFAVLGSVLKAPVDKQREVIATVGEIIGTPEAFAVPAFGAVYSAIMELWSEHVHADYSTLRSMISTEMIDDEELQDLCESIPIWQNASRHAERVRELHDRADTIRFAVRLATAAYHDPPSRFTAADLLSSFVGEAKAIIDDPAAQRKQRRLKNITELEDTAQNEWLWHPYLPPASIALMSAGPKTGKTTILSHVLALTRDGGRLVGEVAPCKVIVVSEESERIWAQRKEAIGIGDNVWIDSIPFPGRPRQDEWESYIQWIGEQAKDIGAEMVIFDTIASLWPCLNENDASEVTPAILPLNRLKKQGLGVLLVHHNRKSGGVDGAAIRGSNAITAAVDVFMELRRDRGEDDNDDANNNRRIIKANGRFDETPDRVMVELKDGRFVDHGSPVQYELNQRMSVLEGLLPTDGYGVVPQDIIDAWPDDCGVATPSRGTVTKDLHRAEREGWAYRPTDQQTGKRKPWRKIQSMVHHEPVAAEF